MRKLDVFLLCFLSLFYYGNGQAAAELAVTSNSIPISKFMLRNEAMTLRNASGQYDISFPIADRIKPLSATLNLALTNSNALIRNRSQLIVYVNDFVVGQIKLDPINFNTEVKFQIEPEFLRQGYNTISFRAAQHYTDDECEDWSAPELWTTINTVKSTLTLNYQAEPVVEKLSELNSLINDRMNGYALTVIRGEQSVSDDYLYWGAVIAQAVKLRLRHVPLTLDEKYLPSLKPAEGNSEIVFKLDPAVLKNDAVLVGSKQQIAELLPSAVNQAIIGPYLGIFRQVNNPSHFILVISGNNNQEVKTSVQAFASLNMPLPDEKETIFKTLQVPNGPDILTDKLLVPGAAYSFSSLGYTQTLLNSVNDRSKLEFRLPADIYSTEDRMVKLNLNLAYGAALRSDSVINLYLNDTFVHAIRLKEIDGAHYHNYEVRLPLRSFKSGGNILTFQSMMTPLESGQCLINQNQNLVAEINGDSIITLPEAGKLATLPDLALLERTGFPFVKNASADDTAFKLLDISSDTIASAWLLIANLTVKEHAPVFDLSVTQGNIPDKSNTVLIGKAKVDKQQAELFQHAPVQVGESISFPHAFKEHPITPEESFLVWVERVLFGTEDLPKSVNLKKDNIVVTQTAGLGDKYLLMSYPTEKGNGVVLALLSEVDNALYPGVDKLFSAGLWEQMQDNVFIWDKNQRFQSIQQGETITLGDENVRLNLIGHFSKHPWQWLILVITLVLGIAWITHKLLKQYHKNVH